MDNIKCGFRNTLNISVATVRYFKLEYEISSKDVKDFLANYWYISNAMYFLISYFVNVFYYIAFLNLFTIFII